VHREVRLSDAERQAIVRRLERALREGRLTVTEFDERTRAAYEANTRADLDELTTDLPPDLW
jgi:DNA-binding transcriptional ArsR family regulator